MSHPLHHVTCATFHPVLPLALIGTTTSVFEMGISNECFEGGNFVVPGSPAHHCGAMLSLGRVVSHVMYWNSVGTADSAESSSAGNSATQGKITRRIAVIVQENKQVIVFDFAHKEMLYRHVPKAKILLEKAGPIAIAKLYAPNLFFVPEIAPLPGKNSNKDDEPLPPTADMGDTKKNLSTIFILCLVRSNPKDLMKIEGKAPVEHIEVHPYAPLLVASHAVVRGLGSIRIFSLLGDKPCLYNVLGSAATMINGLNVLNVAFLPTNVSTKQHTQSWLIPGPLKRSKEQLVTWSNVLVAVIKSRRVAIFDVSTPGMPVELYYILHPTSSLFVGGTIQSVDPTTLWVGTTDGYVVPYSTNDLICAATKLLQENRTSFGRIAFAEDELPPIWQIQQRRPKLLNRDGHHLVTLLSGQTIGRKLPPFTQTAMSFHPTLPMFMSLTKYSFMVKQLSREAFTAGVTSAGAVLESYGASSLTVPPTVYAGQGKMEIPKYFLAADATTIDMCSLRFSAVLAASGADDPKTSEEPTFANAPAAQTATKTPSVRGDVCRTIGALLGKQQLAISNVTQVIMPRRADATVLTPTKYVGIVEYHEVGESKAVFGKGQPPQKKFAVFGFSDTDETGPLHVSTFKCSALAVDRVASMLYFLEEGKLYSISLLQEAVWTKDPKGIHAEPCVIEGELAVDRILQVFVAEGEMGSEELGPVTFFLESTKQLVTALPSVSGENRKVTFTVSSGTPLDLAEEFSQIPVRSHERASLLRVVSQISPLNTEFVDYALLLSVGTLLLVSANIKSGEVICKKRITFSSQTEIVSAQWFGPIIVVLERSGRCWSVSMYSEKRTIATLPTDSRLVCVLPDRIIAMHSACHIVKQNRQASDNIIIEKARMMQAAAEKEIVDAAKSKKADRMASTMHRVNEAKRMAASQRDAPLPVGGLLLCHIEVRLFEPIVAALLRAPVPIPSSTMEYLLGFYDIRVVSRPTLALLTERGLARTAHQLIEVSVNSNVSSTALLYNCGYKSRHHSDDTQAHWPLSIFDNAKILIEKEKSSSSSRMVHSLDDLNWFPSRDGSIIPLRAAAEILALFPPAAVPHALTSQLRKGTIDASHLLFLGRVFAEDAVAARKMVDNITAAQSPFTALVACLQNGDKREKRPDKEMPTLTIKSDFIPPEEPQTIQNVVLSDGTVLQTTCYPSLTSHWTHVSRFRRQIPATLFATGASSRASAVSDDTRTVNSDVKGGSAMDVTSTVEVTMEGSVKEGETEDVSEEDKAAMDKEQELLREQYLQSFRAEVTPDADDEANSATSELTRVLKKGLTLKEKGAAATAAAAQEAQSAATVAVAAAATTAVSAAGAATAQLSLPPRASMVSRRIVTNAEALTLGETLRRAFAAYVALHYDEAIDLLRTARSALLDSPSEIANETKLRQLVHYQICCKIRNQHAGDDESDLPFLIQLVQLKLSNEHLASLCSSILLPLLIASQCPKAAEQVLKLYKFFSPEMSGASSTEALTERVAMIDGSGNAVLDASLIPLVSKQWTVCYGSLQLMSDAEAASAPLCSYCGAKYSAAYIEKLLSEKQQRASLRMSRRSAEASASVSASEVRCEFCGFGHVSLPQNDEE